VRKYNFLLQVTIAWSSLLAAYLHQCTKLSNGSFGLLNESEQATRKQSIHTFSGYAVLVSNASRTVKNAAFVRLSPWLTQTVKTMFAVRCEILDRQDHFSAF